MNPKKLAENKMPKWVDPPSGWMYGFPEILPDDVVNLRQWLIDKGYPERDVDFAMNHMRTWPVDEGQQM